MRAVAAVFFLLLIGIGLFPVVVTFGLPAWHVMRTRDWQAAPCVVTTSDFNRWNGFTTFVVTYRYTVGDVTYRGRSVHTELVADDPFVKDLAAGARCTAWVEPGEPRRATLIRSVPSPGAIVTTASVIFFAVALLGAYGLYAVVARWQR